MAIATKDATLHVSAQVWLLALGMFAIGTDLFIVSGLLPALGRDLELSPAAAGQTVTVFAITYAVLAPVLAGLTARWERRSLLITVLGVFSVGNLLSAIAPNFTVLLVSRFVAGAGAALFAATASAVAARIAPLERRGRSLAIVYAGMTSAIALGVPLGNAIGNVSSWRWAFGFVVLLAVVTAAGLLVCLPKLDGIAGAGIRQRLAAVRIPHAPAGLAITALWVLGTFVVYTYLGTVLESVTRTTPGDRPWLLLLFGIGSFVGVLGGGRIADAISPTLGLGIGIGALVVVLVGLNVVLPSPLGMAIGLTVWGLVHWASFPLIQHRMLKIGGDRGDMLLAMNNSAVYVGQTGAAVVGGLLVGAGLLGRLPLAGAAFEVLAVLVLGLSVLSGSRRRTDREPAGAPST